MTKTNALLLGRFGMCGKTWKGLYNHERMSLPRILAQGLRLLVRKFVANWKSERRDIVGICFGTCTFNEGRNKVKMSVRPREQNGDTGTSSLRILDIRTASGGTGGSKTDNPGSLHK